MMAIPISIAVDMLQALYAANGNSIDAEKGSSVNVNLPRWLRILASASAKVRRWEEFNVLP
jgi:hypothetical protein